MTPPFEIEQECDNQLMIRDACRDVICEIMCPDDGPTVENEENAQTIVNALTLYLGRK